MKTNKIVDYHEPEVQVINALAEGILCASKPDGFGVDNMDIITGGEGTDWDWE